MVVETTEPLTEDEHLPLPPALPPSLPPYLHHQPLELGGDMVSDGRADQPGKEPLVVRRLQARKRCHASLGDGLVQVDEGGLGLGREGGRKGRDGGEEGWRGG
jgi:hypothetical protein